jgi:hypothetical protein
MTTDPIGRRDLMSNHAQLGPKDFERLASQAPAQQQPVQPVTTELAGCIPVVEDVQLANGTWCKQLSFVHISGAHAWKVPLPIPMAKDIATRLSAPRGVEIPANPAAAPNQQG